MPADEATVRSLPAKIAVPLVAALALTLIGAGALAQAAGTTAGRDGGARASVVGGKVATPGQYPWMAFVVDFDEEGGAYTCSGSVIAPRIVLTAAHCVLDEEGGGLNDPTGYRVVTGVVDWTEPERQVSAVTQLIPYPKFAAGTSRQGFGDAALLVLETPTTAPGIQLAKRSDKRFLRVGARARIAGWGQTYYTQVDPTESLMWSKTVVESSRCEGLWGRICAIDFPRAASGACHGDSGGPLFAYDPKRGWLEIGIVEAGFGECSTKRPQIFTRADLLRKWIYGRVRAIESEAAAVPAG